MSGTENGQVKCVYIDPPFNTGEMFENYDDSVEHSLWLGSMRDRLEIIHDLLREDGTLFLHIDDNELGYLIALCDEIFGRDNRISIITFKQSSVSGPKAINPGLVKITSYILYYVKDKRKWSPNKVYNSTLRDSRYSSYINNMGEDSSKWEISTLRSAFADHHGVTTGELKRKFGEKLEDYINDFVLQHAEQVVRLARVQPKDVNREARSALAESLSGGGIFTRSAREDKNDYVFYNGQQVLSYANKVRVIDGVRSAGEVLSNLWIDLLSNNLHNEGGVSFPDGKKPESLIKRLLEIATDEGDLVLDSFAGSGTTGAVAHKMHRRWIMVELKEHAHTHIIPRLQRVIDSVDQSGVTQAVGWKGGGGFRYYRLAPSLIKYDSRQHPIINPEYNAEMLAEACCKLEGFAYDPSQAVWWQHGRSSERDFLFVTTRYMGHSDLLDLSEEVGPERSLLVLAKAYDRDGDRFDNLTVKKIPDAVLGLCEWDHDDYSLKVANLPKAKPEPEPVSTATGARTPRKGKVAAGPGLFDMGGES